MRALRVVGITGDGSVVLEDPGRRERYTVPADEQLRAAARGDVTRLSQIAIELESQLRPREIQARIRGGASVDQVAAAAGVPVQKIERFAYPVLLERSRTAELAQGAHPQRADGPDIRTLGETVAHTFGLRGQDYTTAGWDSWKGDDGKWVVALSWHAGRSDNAAHWAFQPGAHGGTVVALDEHASDLVEGLPARPLRTVGAVVEIGRDDEPEPERPHEPESPQMRAAAAGETRSTDQRRGIAPEQRRSSPPPRGGSASDRTPAGQAPSATRAPAYDSPVDDSPVEAAGNGIPPTVSTDADPAGSRTTGAADPRSAGSVPTDPGTPDASTTGSPTTGEGERSAPPVGDDHPGSTGSGVDNSPEVDTAAASGPAGNEPGAVPAADDGGPDSGVDESTKDRTTGSSGRGAAANRRTKKGKPVMPSWDEVLLGVRGQR